MQERDKVLALLKDTLVRVNSWLTFAETKNAALLGFNVALIAFAYKLKVDKESKLLLSIVFVVCLGIVLLAFLSLCPKLLKYRPPKTRLTDSDKQKSNLLFFGDIKRFTECDYVKEVYKRYLDKEIRMNEISRLELDIAQEIIVNAYIAYRKYELFRIACFAELVSVGLLMKIIM
nr:Pycsar system effector family protein [uncultured Lachnoclostridium sp.]